MGLARPVFDEAAWFAAERKRIAQALRDQLEAEEAEHDGDHCPSCNGTGEGWREGSSCRGRGY